MDDELEELDDLENEHLELEELVGYRPLNFNSCAHLDGRLEQSLEDIINARLDKLEEDEILHSSRDSGEDQEGEDVE